MRLWILSEMRSTGVTLAFFAKMNRPNLSLLIMSIEVRDQSLSWAVLHGSENSTWQDLTLQKRGSLSTEGREWLQLFSFSGAMFDALLKKWSAFRFSGSLGNWLWFKTLVIGWLSIFSRHQSMKLLAFTRWPTTIPSTVLLRHLVFRMLKHDSLSSVDMMTVQRYGTRNFADVQWHTVNVPLRDWYAIHLLCIPHIATCIWYLLSDSDYCRLNRSFQTKWYARGFGFELLFRCSGFHWPFMVWSSVLSDERMIQSCLCWQSSCRFETHQALDEMHSIFVCAR